MLPPHGPIACTKCFAACNDRIREFGDWRVINDPGAWGSSDPEVLVLGFSKGSTQAEAYVSHKFDDVAFHHSTGQTRRRLAGVLDVLGLVRQDTEIDELFTNAEKDFAFGSLVRCSLRSFLWAGFL